MKTDTPTAGLEEIPTWKGIEAFVRTKVQALIQLVLEEEVTASPIEERSVDGHAT